MAPTNMARVAPQKTLVELASEGQFHTLLDAGYNHPFYEAGLRRRPKRTEIRGEGSFYAKKANGFYSRISAAKRLRVLDSKFGLTRALMLVSKGVKDPEDYIVHQIDGLCDNPEVDPISLAENTLEIARSLRDISAGGMRPTTITRAALNYLNEHCCCIHEHPVYQPKETTIDSRFA